MVTGGALYDSLKQYEKDNYYLRDEQGRQLEPEKVGSGWEKLGAQDLKITEVVYRDLKEARNPVTGEQLVKAGVNGEHRAGYNQTFSPDKSFTVYAHSSPEATKQVTEIQDKAVNGVMRYFESDLAQARQTQGGMTEPVKTGNILAMKVDHQVNRLGDVQLHSHLVVFNQTWNEASGKWQALHSDAFHSDILTKMYENQLAFYAKEAGLAVEWKSSDSGKTQYAALAGVPEKAIEATSERSRQVDEYVKEHAAELKEKYPNANEGELKQIAAIETRPEKVSMTREQIDQRFQERLSSVGLAKEDITQGVQKASVAAKEQSTEYVKMNEYELVSTAAKGLAENHATFSGQDILKTSSELSRGDVSITQLQQAIEEMSKDKDIVKLSESHTIEAKGGREYNDQVFTTPEVLKAEKDIVSYARDGQGKAEQVMTQEQAQAAIKESEAARQTSNPDFKLTDDQRAGIEHISTSQDKVIGIQGDAGVGKTTALDVVREIAEKQGYEIRGFAPQGKAAAEMQSASGIQSQTVDSFLARPEVSDQPHQIWIIDEARTLGSKKMSEMTHAAKESGATLVLVGDTKQNPSIDQGDMFAKLQESGAMNTIRMSENIRQKDSPEYQAAMKDLADKKIDKAMDRLENSGKVHEIADRGERLQAIKEDYASRNHKNTVIITARNADRNELNQTIREELKAEGKLKGENHTFTVRESKNIDGVGRHLSQSYQPGDIIKGHNLPGMQNGNEVRVTAIDPGAHTVMAVDKAGKEHSIDLRRDGDKITNVYAEKEQQFAEGDKVVFLKNDKGLDVKNGNIGTVKQIDDRGNIMTTMEGGRELKINPSTQYNYIDHAYAVSEYKSQGGTWQNVIVHAYTSKDTTFNAQYVAQSRGKQDVQIYTDDKAELREDMKHEQHKSSTLDFEKSQQAKHAGIEKSGTGKNEISGNPEHETVKSNEAGHGTDHGKDNSRHETHDHGKDSGHEEHSSSKCDNHSSSQDHVHDSDHGHNSYDSGKDSGHDYEIEM
ncbi:MAG: MobF family relaxase [Dissulfurispiraceae bacterium]|jgi:conjugative relaxase-like TrwC/TraI family protein